jgi:hypothetical protein
VHFLVIGAGFFLFWQYFGDRLSSPPERIVVTPGQVERLAQQWTRTHLRPPSAEELGGLVEQEIDEEILFREAVALGLDRDDPVIRRRLALKMDFVTQDVASAAMPTEAQLQAFLSQHPEKFHTEMLTSFAQVYVNASLHGDGAWAEADRVLALLGDRVEPGWQALGDPLPLPAEHQAVSDAEIARLFGRGFSKELSALPVGRWSGPVKSGYGLHLVLVRERTPARPPGLGEVHDQVVSGWQEARRQELSANLRRQRRARYAVTVEWPDWAAEVATLAGDAGNR